jgi:hypothetical protein
MNHAIAALKKVGHFFAGCDKCDPKVKKFAGEVASGVIFEVQGASLGNLMDFKAQDTSIKMGATVSVIEIYRIYLGGLFVHF